jgi:hypothetical protein
MNPKYHQEQIEMNLEQNSYGNRVSIHLQDCVGAKLFPPSQHLRPHLHRLVEVELPGFQKPALIMRAAKIEFVIVKYVYNM